MLLSTSGVRMLIRSLPAVGELVLAPPRHQQARAQLRRSERMAMFSAIDHSGKMPSDWRSPATSATGALISIARAAAGPLRRRRRRRRSVWPWPASPARPTISPRVGDELGCPSALAAGRGRAPARRLRCALGARRPPPAPALLRRRPWRRPGAARSKALGGIGDDDLAVAHDDDAVAVSRISPSRWEIRMQLAPLGHGAADEGEQLAARCARRARRSARRG